MYSAVLPMFELMDGRIVSRAQNLMPHQSLPARLAERWNRIEDSFIERRGHEGSAADVNTLNRRMRKDDMWVRFANNGVARVLYYTLRTRPRAMLLNRESGAPFHEDVQAIRGNAEK